MELLSEADAQDRLNDIWPRTPVESQAKMLMGLYTQAEVEQQLALLYMLKEHQDAH